VGESSYMLCGVGVRGYQYNVRAIISVFLEGNPEGPRLLEPRLKYFGSKHRHFSYSLNKSSQHLRKVSRTA
jgi:hypothetical protein